MNPIKHTNLIIISALILVNFIIYFNGIKNEFVWDDDFLVKNNHYITDTCNIKNLLTKEDAVPNFPGTGYYRSLVNLTYMFDYQIFKDEAYGYRLTNIVFHLLCSIVLFFLVMLITRKPCTIFHNSAHILGAGGAR